MSVGCFTPYRELGAKTSFDVFSLSQEQVWTFSVLDDRIYEMRCLFEQWDSMPSL